MTILVNMYVNLLKKRVIFMLQKGKHCVYDLNFHLVLVVKYRKKCINQEIGDFLISECKRLIEMYNGMLTEGNYDMDHIHLLISMPPTCKMDNFVGMLKNTLSRNVRKQYGEYLQQYLYGDSFWSDSYYLGTTGGANLETIRQYIEYQGQPKRKYIRANKTVLS